MRGGARAPRTCTHCRRRPVAWSAPRPTEFCYACMPGGPHVPPPCRRCGRTEGYYSAGLCDRCHRRAPQPVTSCRDCHAWGARRTHQWLCSACRHWRRNYPIGTCRACGSAVAVNTEQACRLCWRQFVDQGGKKAGLELEQVNRFGHQLFLVDLHHASAGRAIGTRRTRGAASQAHPAAPQATPRPVAHRQLLLFEIARDLRAGRTRGFGAPTDPELAGFLDQFLIDHATRHGWSRSSTKQSRRGLAILLSLQDTPGAPLRTAEIGQLRQIGLTTLRLLEVCAAAGVLDDDRTPTTGRWFTDTIAGLPAPMRGELDHWFTIMIQGSSAPPRSRPRSETTARLYLQWSMPALHAWAAAGQTSLREIARDDVAAVLPVSGTQRAQMGQGLRGIFRVLKAHRLVFLNPITGIRIGTHQHRHPMPLPTTAVREALTSLDPTRAALGSLVAFHGMRSGQLRGLQLTDIHTGRLHLDGRVIPLAEPVRDRLAAWLTHRDKRWPQTPNPHLFISKRTALRTAPVGVEWITRTLGMTTQAIREDRILNELHATNGDVRRICDLFGLTIAGAARYASVLNHPDLDHH